MTNEQICRLAELIAETDLSRPVMGRFRRPLFRATRLGEKYPTVDLIVDLLGRDDLPIAFFFVQVKGTAGRTNSSRLPISLDQQRYNRLVQLPAPTYLIGVDVNADKSYLVAANRRRIQRLSSITKDYCLREDSVRIALYREVLAFWKAHRTVLQQTKFKNV